MKDKYVSVRLKIMLPMISVAVLLICSCIFSVYDKNNMMHASEDISMNCAVNIERCEELKVHYESLQKIVYSHIVAKELAAMEALEEEYKYVIAEIDKICAEVEKEQEFIRFKESYDEYLKAFAVAIESSSNNESERAIMIANAKLSKIGEEISMQLTEMVNRNKAEMEEAIRVQKETYVRALVSSAVIFIIACVTVFFGILVSWKAVAKPVSEMTMKLHTIVNKIEAGNGDLTERIGNKSKDEVGQLADGINMFIETLQRIMKQINGGTKDLDVVVENVAEEVKKANDSSCDISAIMEELSVSMEEVSATVINMRQGTVTADIDIRELAENAKELSGYTNGMQNRARELEQSAIENKQVTSEMINTIINKLERAMEDCKAVSKVNELTGDILNISSQTNLLSLNASIEAARAGEAGKGFAVVASEISQLAASSHKAANNIQSINEMVILAVNELTASANIIIEYMNKNILPDYDRFVHSGRQYNMDAAYINKIVMQFDEKSKNLQEIISGLAEAINGIAQAVDESAKGVSGAAENTMSLVRDINQIEKEIIQNRRIAGELSKEADCFVKL